MNIKKRAVKKVNPEFRCMLKKERFKHATKLSRINTYYICRIMFEWCCLWASIKPGTGNISEHEKINIFFMKK